jgi:hypothetical protein
VPDTRYRRKLVAALSVLLLLGSMLIGPFAHAAAMRADWTPSASDLCTAGKPPATGESKQHGPASPAGHAAMHPLCAFCAGAGAFALAYAASPQRVLAQAPMSIAPRISSHVPPAPQAYGAARPQAPPLSV